MRNSLGRTAIVLALLGGAGPVAAAADRPLYLTFAQEHVIYRGLTKEKGESIPAGFQPSIGAAIPPSLSSHQLPGSVTDRIPAAKRYEYLKLSDDKVLLIDPEGRQVVDIIDPQT